MQVAVDVSLAYHIEPSMVPAFYVKFRNDNLDGFTYGYLHSLARDKFNDIAGHYHIEQIMGDNGPFLREVKASLQKDLEPIGVRLEAQFGIIGAPRPPDAVIASINAKVQAVQIAQQKQNEVVQAEAEARKTVAMADGQAKSILAVATAQAEANRKIAESVTTNLIQYKQLEKWNGVLPQVSGGATPFINLSNK
jgi:regulator of protease activity HflC (stomatin/prohibitin superfamily)